MVQLFQDGGWAMWPLLVLLVFGIAVLTGILFGLYPARKAAAMNPVDALRHAT